MADRPYNALFLCTGNSARSLMAEAILNDHGDGRFRAFSAGSHPKDALHALTLDVLRRNGHDTASIRSKSWDEFAGPGAPRMDFVFTVCDNAAAEVCPVWPGQPITAHRGLPDPAAEEGGDVQRSIAFARAYGTLTHRIGVFASLPIASLDRLALKQALDEIATDDTADYTAGVGA